MEFQAAGMGAPHRAPYDTPSSMQAAQRVPSLLHQELLTWGEGEIL